MLFNNTSMKNNFFVILQINDISQFHEINKNFQFLFKIKLKDFIINTK